MRGHRTRLQSEQTTDVYLKTQTPSASTLAVLAVFAVGKIDRASHDTGSRCEF
jgi:hypothetical protein